MVDEARARKLADRIARIVAEMLERRVKDPRLGFVTVTEARLTSDLRDATVYYTVYGTDEERTGTAAALASATGLIRSEVGRQLGLRHTPSLVFTRDTLPEGARHLEELVEKARAADAALAAAREGAQPAGEADPYRSPPEPEDDGEADEQRETWHEAGAEDDWADRFRPGAAGGTPSAWADGSRRGGRPARRSRWRGR